MSDKFDGDGARTIAGTRARACRDPGGWTGGRDVTRRKADNKIVIVTGRCRQSDRFQPELCYEVIFEGEACWFDRRELAVIPERISDLDLVELETQFLEAEQYALAWDTIGGRSGERQATRWMEIAGELRTEMARRWIGGIS